MIKIGNNIRKFSTYSCQPKNYSELADIVNKRINSYGPDCDLNDIDTSLIDDMSYLFCRLEFNGDISKWDVSNVTAMAFMFKNCNSFNQDLSSWNVSKVRCIIDTFNDCPIKDEYKPKFK